MPFSSIERDHPVVEQIGGGERGLSVIKLGEADGSVGVDVGLLVDASDALERPDIEGVLGPQYPGHSETNSPWASLSALAFSRVRPGASVRIRPSLKPSWPRALEPVLHGLQVNVAQPRLERTPKGEMDIPCLASSFDIRVCPQAGWSIAMRPQPPLRSRARPGSSRIGLRRDIPLQRQFPAFVIEILEPVEAVPAVAHDLAGLADVAELRPASSSRLTPWRE